MLHLALAAATLVPQIVGGADHYCVLDAEGAKCWGTRARSARLYIAALDRRESDFFLSSGDVNALDSAFGWGRNPASDDRFNYHGENVRPRTVNDYCLLYDAPSCTTRDASVAPAFARLDRPQRIWAGGENTCALDATGLHCWGATDIAASTPTMRHVEQLSLSQTHACAHDGQRIQCWSTAPDKLAEEWRVLQRSTTPRPQPAWGITGAAATRSAEGLLMFSTPTHACLYAPPTPITDPLGTAECTMSHAFRASEAGTQRLSLDYLVIGDATMAAASPLFECFASVPPTNSSELLWCQGRNGEASISARGIRQIAANNAFGCVLDADGVRCLQVIGGRTDRSNGWREWRVPFTDPQAIAAAGFSVCALDRVAGLAVRCFDLARRREIPAPALAITDDGSDAAQLGRVEHAIDALAEHAYRPKAAILARAAAIARAHTLADDADLRGDAGEVRLLILNMVDILAQLITTPYFETVLAPAFHSQVVALNRAAGIADLRDVAIRPATDTAALQLAEETLAQLAAATDGAEHAALVAARADIGRALAAPPHARDTRRTFQAVAARLSFDLAQPPTVAEWTLLLAIVHRYAD